MIPKEFYKDIGLTEKQTEAITKAMNNERRYRDLLRRAGVNPKVVDKIAEKSDTSIIDEIGEVALLEIVKEEWAAFIPNNRKGV